MSSNGLWGLLAAAPHRQRLPDSEVHRLYPRYRLRIMESTFFGYAAFYLVRNNLSVVSRDMQGALHYDASMLGNILAVTAITYGLIVSDNNFLDVHSYTSKVSNNVGISTFCSAPLQYETPSR